MLKSYHTLHPKLAQQHRQKLYSRILISAVLAVALVCVVYVQLCNTYLDSNNNPLQTGLDENVIPDNLLGLDVLLNLQEKPRTWTMHTCRNFSQRQAASGLLIRDGKMIRVYMPEQLYREAALLKLSYPLSVDIDWGNEFDLPASKGIAVNENAEFINVPIDHYFKALKLWQISPNWKVDSVARIGVCVNVSLSNCKDCKSYSRCEPWQSANLNKAKTTLVTVLEHESQVQLLEEWIDHHQAIGVEQFVLYNLIADQTVQMLAVKYPDSLGKLLQQSNMAMINWAKNSRVQMWKLDFAARFDKVAEWFAILSLDEFLMVGNSSKKIGDYVEFGKDVRKRHVGQLILPVMVFGPNGHVSKPGAPTVQAYTKSHDNYVYNLNALIAKNESETFEGVTLSNRQFIGGAESCCMTACGLKNDQNKFGFATVKVTPDKLSVHKYLRSFEEMKQRLQWSAAEDVCTWTESVTPKDYFVASSIFEKVSQQ